nr:MAG TPA: hypothetical protein [Caudoviricetes sp.]
MNVYFKCFHNLLIFISEYPLGRLCYLLNTLQR